MIGSIGNNYWPSSWKNLSSNNNSLFGLTDQTDDDVFQDIWSSPEIGGTGVYDGLGGGSLFGSFNNWLGSDAFSGLSDLAGIAGNIGKVYGGLQQTKLAKDMWNTNKDYLSMNAWNQGVMLDEERAKHRATMNGLRGTPVDRSYVDNPEKIRRVV